MSNFRFVIISKDDKFVMDIPSSDNIKFEKIANNRENITKVYNKILDEEKQSQNSDFLIFMHSDVKVDIAHLVSHIEECKDKYDVMGLCGCAKISMSQHPLNWFCGSRPFPESRWGCVTHGELHDQTSYFSAHSPSVTDHEVACIDGLCMIFGRKAIEDDKIRFDERLRFNCYDTQISMTTVLTNRKKLGVLVEKSLYHYSVGKSILTEDFQKDEDILRCSFGIPLS